MRNQFKDIITNTVKRKGVEDLLVYIEDCSDFFIAPCSTKYHLNRYGGLLEHSLHVYNVLKDLCDKYYPNVYSDETIAIVGLLHDICKTNFYSFSNGKYIVDDKFPFGHGEKSAYIISKFINLTDEEAIAIRYHMGAWDSSVKGGDYSYVSAQKLPLVTLVQCADQLSTFILEA